MFFPQEMTEMELIVPEKELLSVTSLLARQGIFHQVDASYMSSRANVEEGDTWKDRASAYGTLERQIGLLMQTLDVDEGMPPKADQDVLAELGSVRPLVEQIEGEVKGSNSRLTDSQKSLEKLRNSIHELEPIADVDIDMGQLHHSRYIYSILGTMPAANLQRLETSLGRIPHVLTKLREGGDTAVVWLTGPRGNEDILERAARSAYIDPLALSDDYHGTPAQIIKELNESVQKTEADVQSEKAGLHEFNAKYGEQLQNALWSVRASRMLADAMAHHSVVVDQYDFNFTVHGTGIAAFIVMPWPGCETIDSSPSSDLILSCTPRRPKPEETRLISQPKPSSRICNCSLFGVSGGLVKDILTFPA